jgi:hypothetical protein
MGTLTFISSRVVLRAVELVSDFRVVSRNDFKATPQRGSLRRRHKLLRSYERHSVSGLRSAGESRRTLEQTALSMESKLVYNPPMQGIPWSAIALGSLLLIPAGSIRGQE